MTVDDFHHNEAIYALAVEKADYRRACWIAISALRRAKGSRAVWTMRLCGALKRRAW